MRSHRAGHYSSMDETLAMLALGGGGSAGGGVGYAFVFRPGGVTDKNVFATWPALIAAISAVQGPKLVEIDVSLAPAVVPAGSWNLNDVTLVGVPQQTAIGQPLLTFGPGALIDPATLTLTVDQSLGIAAAAPGHTIWTPSGAGGIAPTLYLKELSFLTPSPGVPLIHVTAGVTFVVDSNGGGIGDTINPVIQVDAGGNLAMNASNGGGTTAHAVSGTGTWDLAIVPGGFFEQPQTLVPTITYIDPPQTIGEANAGPLTAAPVVFTSTGAITRRSSGLVQGSACASVTGAGAGAPVTFDVLRNPGGVLIATQTVDGGATHTQCTVPVSDTLPDQVSHTYAIRVTQAATALTIAAGQARIALSELT